MMGACRSPARGRLAARTQAPAPAPAPARVRRAGLHIQVEPPRAAPPPPAAVQRGRPPSCRVWGPLLLGLGPSGCALQHSCVGLPRAGDCAREARTDEVAAHCRVYSL